MVSQKIYNELIDNTMIMLHKKANIFKGHTFLEETITLSSCANTINDIRVNRNRIDFRK